MAKRRELDPVKMVMDRGLAAKPRGLVLGPVQVTVLAKYLIQLNLRISKYAELLKGFQQGDDMTGPTETEGEDQGSTGT